MADYSELTQDAKSRSWRCTCTCFVKLLAVLVIVLIIGGLSWHVIFQPKPTPVITIQDGPIQGNIRYSRDGKEYWQFLGIPFAKPPVGKLKFEPPAPVKPWTNLKQVTNYPPDCAQLDMLRNSRPTGDLNCLFLNVFVNAANGNGTDGKLKPVLVYIYGGGFLSGGSGIYQPDFFMDHEVVVVTFNYRLGPFGFLNLKGDEGARGNMGLMDQVQALRWVQKNIAAFGGNVDSVTIFGESSGSVATQLHVLSPMSRGLFHRAFAQSGSVSAPWAFTKTPRDMAEKYAKRLGCKEENNNNNKTNNGSALWDCYKNADWKELLKFQDFLMEPLKEITFFLPSVDGEFLKDDPLTIMKSGNIPKIPVMFGVNGAEGVIRSARFKAMPELIPKLDEEWNSIHPNLMFLSRPLSPEVAMSIKEKYFGNANFTEDVEGFIQNLTLLASDGGFFNPVHRSAMYHAKNGAPTYLFFYNYSSSIFPSTYSVYSAARLDDWMMTEVKLIWRFGIDWIKEYVFGMSVGHKYGVAHGEDVFQLWNVLGYTKCISRWDEDFSKSFVKVIVDFANDTEPLTFRGTSWPPINDYLSSSSGKDEYSIPYMLIDNQNKPKVVPEPFGSRIKFWNELPGWDN